MPSTAASASSASAGRQRPGRRRGAPRRPAPPARRVGAARRPPPAPRRGGSPPWPRPRAGRGPARAAARSPAASSASEHQARRRLERGDRPRVVAQRRPDLADRDLEPRRRPGGPAPGPSRGAPAPRGSRTRAATRGPPRGRPRRPRRPGRRPARGRRSAPGGPDRRDPPASARRTSATRRWRSRRRARPISSYAASRSRACPKSKAGSPPLATSRTIPRRTSSSSAVTVSSSERPLAAAHRREVERAADDGAAARTWPAVSPTLARRSRSSARTPRGGAWPVGSRTRHERLDDVQREPLGLRGERRRVPGRQARGGRRVDERADHHVVQPLQPHRRRTRERRGSPSANAVAPGLQVLGAPREQQEHRPRREPPGEVQERLARRVVRPLQVLDRDDARERDRGRSPRGPSAIASSRRARAAGESAGPAAAAPAVTPAGRGTSRSTSARVAGASAGEALGRTSAREPRAEQLHDRRVGDGPFGREGACREDGGPVGDRGGGKRLHEAGLADPGLAGDRGDAPVRRRRAERVAERRQLPAPAQHRQLDRWLGRCRSRHRGDLDGRRWPPGTTTRTEPLVPDRLVQVRRLGERRHAQLPLQHRPRWHGTGGSPRPGRRRARGRPSAAAARARRAGPAPRAGWPPRPRPRGRRPPRPPTTSRSSTSTIRRSTVTARVARQSSKSGLSRSENPARNGPRARVAASASAAGSIRGRRRLERGEVQPHAVAVIGQRHGRTVHAQPPVAERRPQHGQRPPQRAPGGLVVRLRPEHRRQLVPGVRPPLHRQQRQDRRRLPRVDAQRLAVHVDLERAEHADLERCGGRGLGHGA